jgi:peptidoglycan biosynthesis protein MviN/MurJ (putative lipid II flippase)
MHLMTFVWFAFTVVLFALEPLFLHRWFIASAKRDSDRAFRLLQRMHWVLLTLSLVAIVGAVAGSRGYLRL